MRIVMRSKITRKDNEDLVKLCQSMKPGERLVAFLNHSRLIHRLHKAGQSSRKRSIRTKRKKNALQK
jgi:hypothetical protein